MNRALNRTHPKQMNQKPLKFLDEALKPIFEFQTLNWHEAKAYPKDPQSWHDAFKPDQKSPKPSSFKTT